MSCRRAFEHDLPGFLADPRAPEHAEFRDHYPRCAACAAEVRAWTELAAALAAAAPAHPAPERLLRFADARGALAAGERATLEAHLAGCAACRDELAALARFDPAALAARAPAGEEGAGSWLAALRRALWHPAFAYALLLLLAVPTVYTLVRPEPHDGQRGAAAPGPAAEPEAVAGQAEASPQRAHLAEPDDAAASEQAAEAPAADALVTQASEPPSADAPPGAEAPRAFSLADAQRERAAAESVASLEAAPRAAAPADAASPPPLRFEHRPGGLAALRVPVAPDAGECEVRLVAPDGRSLVQRLAPQAGGLELLVAEDWLASGAHRVEVHGPDGVALHSALPPS